MTTPLAAGPAASGTGQLVGLAVMAVLVTVGLLRRIRPQPVRPNRILITAGVIVLVTLASFAATPWVLTSPLGLVLGLLCLLAGLALGVVLVRVSRLWRNPSTGELWMEGGLPFALIFVGTLALRMGVRYATTGNVFASGPRAAAAEASSPLALLSADLLLLSAGTWLARAFLLVRRHRQEMRI